MSRTIRLDQPIDIQQKNCKFWRHPKRTHHHHMIKVQNHSQGLRFSNHAWYRYQMRSDCPIEIIFAAYHNMNYIPLGCDDRDVRHLLFRPIGYIPVILLVTQSDDVVTVMDLQTHQGRYSQYRPAIDLSFGRDIGAF